MNKKIPFDYSKTVKYRICRGYGWENYEKPTRIKSVRVSPHMEIVAPLKFIKTALLRKGSSSKVLRETAIDHLNIFIRHD